MTEASTEVESPFLPGTQLQWAWDSTSLGAFKRCPRLYAYTMLEGWTTKSDAIHLRWGIEYHRALQDYDIERANGMDHNEAVYDTLYALLHRIGDWDPEPHTDSEELKTKPNLVRTVLWYLDKFENDPAATFIKSDGSAAVEQSFRFELDYTVPGWAQPYMLCGHLDKIVTFNDELFVLDHKTSSRAPGSYFFDQFEPDNQMSLYTLASKVVLHAPIKGVIIDAAQVADGWARFVRGFTYRTEDQLEEWLKDLRHWFGLAAIYANQGYWPQNDTACDKYGGCRFRGICSKSPRVRGQFLKANFVQLPENERWNPLKPR